MKTWVSAVAAVKPVIDVTNEAYGYPGNADVALPSIPGVGERIQCVLV
jgi:hypothetical protein